MAEVDVHRAVVDHPLPEEVLGNILPVRRTAETVTETMIAIAVAIETALAALILGKLSENICLSWEPVC